ncbi:hypothetical protein ACWD7Y_33435, partial [Streptomyces drozdowiczii]
MNSASREALAAARERLDALTDSTSVDAAKLAEDLAGVTALLHREAPGCRCPSGWCSGWSRGPCCWCGGGGRS